jgi:hypothetical protein
MNISQEVINKINPVKRAISEGRLLFFASGQYKYTPSKEYMEKYGNRPKDEIRKNIVIAHLDADKKLLNLNQAFIVAKKTNRKVVDCHNGKVRLQAR